MIVVIDYDAGNLYSVTNALSRLGAEFIISSDKEIIAGAEKVIFPGVGMASQAMDKLRERGLVETIKNLTQPFLGICLGMQLMCRYSEEGDTECLGLIPIDVIKMRADKDNKVPHIGWNNIKGLSSPLFKGVKEDAFVYYVHSYAAPVTQYTICSTEHSDMFSGAIQFNNFYGCQFHPEKSGDIGSTILKNFLEL